jgi:hypothetical protein
MECIDEVRESSVLLHRRQIPLAVKKELDIALLPAAALSGKAEKVKSGIYFVSLTLSIEVFRTLNCFMLYA